MKPKLKIYLSSKMTGCTNYNYHNFFRVQKVLQKLGWVVINPARNFGSDQTLEYKDYMRAAMHDLLQADAVYVFGNWRDSEGVGFELHIAHKLGIPVLSRKGTEND